MAAVETLVMEAAEVKEDMGDWVEMVSHFDFFFKFNTNFS